MKFKSLTVVNALRERETWEEDQKSWWNHQSEGRWSLKLILKKS